MLENNSISWIIKVTINIHDFKRAHKKKKRAHINYFHEFKALR